MDIVSYYPAKSDNNCCICLQPMAESDSVVAHNNPKARRNNQISRRICHLHRECIDKHLFENSQAKCPTCNRQINKNSLMPLHKRALQELSYESFETIWGITLAAILASATPAPLLALTLEAVTVTSIKKARRERQRIH